MSAFITPETVPFAILGLMCVEGLLLTALNIFKGVGPHPSAVWSNLLAGAALVLALRSALIGDPFPVIAIWLAASLVAHILDLFVRWKRS